MTALMAKTKVLFNWIFNIELLLKIQDKDWKMGEVGQDMS